MSTTFVFIPKEEEAKNALLNLVGELEYFFPHQLVVRDALALQSKEIGMQAFMGLLAVQLDAISILESVKSPEPEDVWAPLSETEDWKPLGELGRPEHFREPCVVIPAEESTEPSAEVVASTFGIPKVYLFCQECGDPLTGKKKKFCSQSCYNKDYRRRHPYQGKSKRNNGGSGAAEESGQVPATEMVTEAATDEEAETVQVLPWKILSSGMEVNDIGRLLEAKKLKLGELVTDKGGYTYQVTSRLNGDYNLRPV